jgi:hypothetical protein
MQTHVPVKKQILFWKTRLNGTSHLLEIPVFHSVDPGRSQHVILNLNGIGEGSYSASVAPRMFDGVISAILPFQDKSLELTVSNIEEVARKVPPILVDFARQLGGEQKLGIVARSQGAAVAIKAVRNNIETFDKLAVVMPFGLNRQELGYEPASARKEILRRLAKAGVRGNLFDYGNFRSASEVVRYLMKAAWGRQLLSSFDAALTFDLTKELIEIAESIPVALFVSQDDPLFPAHEIEPKFKGTKVHVFRIRGNHVSPGSRVGKRQIAAAYKWMRGDG